MKKLFLIMACFTFLSIGCADGDQQIDKTAEEAKKVLEEFGEKAGDILDQANDGFKNSDGSIEGFKGIIDSLAIKAKEVNQKIEKDTAFKRKIKDFTKNFEKDAKSILEELEKVIEDASKETPKKE